MARGEPKLPRNRVRHPITALGLAGAAVFALLFCLALPAGQARAQSTLTPDVREVLDRLDKVNRTGGHTAGILSDADRAILFKNNDAINAARLNNEIPNSVYQAAQSDFADLNQKFAADAAAEAGADFTVQQRSSQTYSPGTDSDYITVVKDRNQIGQMQEGYNNRVNDFLEKNGAITERRTDWQNKLDTDFMADPRHVSEAEFREIAKMNNDAYKNRFAADYERISRAKGGGKIGPEHVTGYAEEMNSFAQKKGGKIRDMFDKGPAYFNDPKNRAEIFQAMAQEQKYVSRMESLDDYLRAQEGLPPRNRGKTLAAQGSNRAPSNAATIREAHAASDASRFAAMEDLAETMGDVAKKNPAFRPSAADDIAKIVEGLPPARRQAALTRLRSAHGAGFVDEIVEASRASGRAPSGGVLDDLARTADDALRPGAIDDIAKGGMRGALGRGATALAEAVGHLGAAFDVYSAASQLNDYYDAIQKARDPNSSDEEANAAFARAQEIANALIEAGVIGAIVESSPAAAIAWGTWTISRHGGQWILDNTQTGQRINRAVTEYAGRHVTAWDRASDWWTGKAEEREAHARALCDKFMAAVRDKRVKTRGSFRVLDVCNAIRRGDTIADMIETADVSPDDVAVEPPKQPEIALLPPTCDAAQNDAIVASLQQAAADGSDVAAGHVARVRAINGQIAAATARMQAARQSYASGDMSAARAALTEARTTVDGMGGEPDCSDLGAKISGNLDKVDRMERVLSEAREAVGGCSAAAVERVRQRYASIGHAALNSILSKADGIVAAETAFEDARAAYAAGELAVADGKLTQARAAISRTGGGACSDLSGRIDEAIDRVGRLRDAIRTAERAVASCNLPEIERWSVSLAKLSNPATGPVKSKLRSGKQDCEDKVAADRDAACARKHGSGYYAGSPDASGTYYCIPNQTAADAWCNANNAGSGWKANGITAKGGFDCKKSPGQQQAENDASCRRQHGAGYHAGKPDRNGTFYCRPDKRTANAWCNANNPGSGWYAGKISSKGAYNCIQSGKARSQQAWADCRRQFGTRLVNVKFLKDGRYQCIYNTGTARQQPTHDTRSSSAAAAAAGALIQGIFNAAGNRDRGRQPGAGDRRPPSNTARTPQRTQPTQRGPICFRHDKNTSTRWSLVTDLRCKGISF